MIRSILTLLLCILFMARSGEVTAQSSASFPSAVLVQLRAEKNRIDAMIVAHQYALAAIARKDAANIRAAMMNDFRDHFHFCPVYFYMDTDFDKIMKHEFSGVLFNADSTEVTDPVISDSNPRYLIVYYGYPALQARHGVVTKEIKERANNAAPPGKALVINNNKMAQLDYIYIGSPLLGNKKKSLYKYSSKKFDMEYYPTAARLESRMKEDASSLIPAEVPPKDMPSLIMPSVK